MEYQNPKPTEGINYSQEHPLKEFVILIIGVAVIVVVVIFTLNAIAGRFASHIPFDFEKKMVAQFELSIVEQSPQQKYLQDLADRLTPHMDLPEQMAITVHYDDSDTVNAFATLGGNLIFFRGLIDKMKSENELAAVMGHEIAHIKYRHPIVALGKGLTLASFAAFVTGASGSVAGEWLIGSSANLSMMKFSREQESASDAASAQMLQRYYGNIGGVKELFKTFSEIEGDRPDQAEAIGNTKMVEMFRSHPFSEDRWSSIHDLAKQKDWQFWGKQRALQFPGESIPPK
ncbi:MAG: putative Zn-dependent protease [Arenicella sp.]